MTAVIDSFMSKLMQKRIDKALDLMASVEEGRELTDLVRSGEISVFYDDKMHGGATAYFSTWDNSVHLSYMSGGTLLRTLLHELSHARQYHVAGIAYPRQCTLTQRDGAIWSRLIEGEADANASRVIQAINRKNGTDYRPGIRGFTTALTNWIWGKRLTPDALCERAFSKFQRSWAAQDYDKDAHVRAKRWKAEEKIPLKQQFNNAALASLFRNGEGFYLGAKTTDDLIDRTAAFTRK